MTVQPVTAEIPDYALRWGCIQFSQVGCGTQNRPGVRGASSEGPGPGCFQGVSPGDDGFRTGRGVRSSEGEGATKFGVSSVSSGDVEVTQGLNLPPPLKG